MAASVKECTISSKSVKISSSQKQYACPTIMAEKEQIDQDISMDLESTSDPI